MAIREFDIVRVGAGVRRDAHDSAAVEEPLQVRIDGQEFAVIMRTPGADRELVAGFLLAERLVRSADDLSGLDVGRGPDTAGRHNVVDVRLASGTRPLLPAPARRVTANASCGVCGRQTIDSLTTDAPPVTVSWSVGMQALHALPDRLREAQPVFGSTGGLHAAALLSSDGVLDDVAEDVGRHNAVDKVIGRALLERRLPLSDRGLFVSGRASFEIVQKALVAGIPLVAAVSAPSSLAIDLARASGITLVGFVRNSSFNVYSHPGRIEPARSRTSGAEADTNEAPLGLDRPSHATRHG